MAATDATTNGLSVNHTRSDALSHETVLAEILNLLRDITTEWDIGGASSIGPATRLVADLEFVSVDIVHLIVAIEEHFNRPRMGFQELLMKDGRYVDELKVAEIAAFVSRKLVDG